MRARLPALVVVTALAVITAAATSAAAAPAGKRRCTRPFRGTIERLAADGHQAVELSGSDVSSAVAVDFGNQKNFTVYLGDFRIPRRAIGSTLEAPAGKTLVTAFVRAKDGGDLREGLRLRVGRDQVSAVIDSGGGAQATTTGAEGSVRVLELGDRHVCFAFDYQDGQQVVRGTTRAPLVAPA